MSIESCICSHKAVFLSVEKAVLRLGSGLTLAKI